MSDSPKLILIMGLPGSGKTYLAKLLADRFGFHHLSSDRVRKDLGKMGQYSLQDKLLIYDTLLDSAQDLLAKGGAVIVDTTFSSQILRDRFRKMAQAWTDKICWVLAYANDAVTKKRLAKKREDSEADFEIYQKMKEHFDPVQMDHLQLQTDQMSEDELVAKVDAFCRKKS